MPRISFFYGIVIRMYWNERDHPVPHFHAEYGDQSASLALGGHSARRAPAPQSVADDPPMGATAPTRS